VFFALNRDTLGCWAMRCGRRRGARLPKPLELPFLDARANRGQFRVGRRNDMNDKNEQSQSQGQEVALVPFPELDSFILGLTPEKLKDSATHSWTGWTSPKLGSSVVNRKRQVGPW
jgi:hypothetical protein